MVNTVVSSINALAQNDLSFFIPYKEEMFNSLPKVSKLKKTFYNKFWNEAIKQLEKRLRYPNKTLAWKERDLCDDLKEVSGSDLTVIAKVPQEETKKKVSLSSKTKELVTDDERPRHSMTLRPRPGGLSDVAALDPGIRTFQTLYDTKNNVIEFGVGDVYLMRLDSKGLRKKIKNIHIRLAKFLTSRYGLILVPRLDLKNSKDPYYAVWEHPKFVDRLFAQAKKRGGHVIEVEEMWTSKTCSSCGKICDPGRSKTFECRYCGLVIDRDINGARNILLKNMHALEIDIE